MILVYQNRMIQALILFGGITVILGSISLLHIESLFSNKVL